MTINKKQIKGIARHLRLVCSEEIEDLEDQLPQVTNLIERDSIKKQIEALHEMADEVNRRAEFLIGEYENDSKS
jgi:archaellum component FlaC